MVKKKRSKRRTVYMHAIREDDLELLVDAVLAAKAALRAMGTERFVNVNGCSWCLQHSSGFGPAVHLRWCPYASARRALKKIPLSELR